MSVTALFYSTQIKVREAVFYKCCKVKSSEKSLWVLLSDFSTRGLGPNQKYFCLDPENKHPILLFNLLYVFYESCDRPVGESSIL